MLLPLRENGDCGVHRGRARTLKDGKVRATRCTIYPEIHNYIPRKATPVVTKFPLRRRLRILSSFPVSREERGKERRVLQRAFIAVQLLFAVRGTLRGAFPALVTRMPATAARNR